MYKFCAVKYSDKIAKVSIVRRGKKEDVTDLTTCVGIWPRRSGWCFGYVDLLKPTAWAYGEGEDDEGFPSLTKRWYGLVKIVWERWTHPDRQVLEEKMDRSDMCELTSQERAARVAWALALGRCLTVEQVVDMTGLQERAARELLGRLSRVLPVVRVGRAWRALLKTS